MNRALHPTRTILVVALIVTFGASARLVAHDFWMKPSTFTPKVGALVALRLLVGQDAIGDPVPRDDQAIKQFVVAGATGTTVVPGRDGADPAGIVRVAAPGLMITGYESLPRVIELPPEKFAQYLGEEGLDQIQSVFTASPQRRAARELFSRCAKSLLASGEPAAMDHDRALGLTLELVADRNPYAMRVGEPLAFTLTYRGTPQPGVLVIAASQRDPAITLRARTDRRGRVAFTLPTGGGWLVKAVHMVPAPADSHADWQSYWASSTFEIAGHNAAASE